MPNGLWMLTHEIYEKEAPLDDTALTGARDSPSVWYDLHVCVLQATASMVVFTMPFRSGLL